ADYVEQDADNDGCFDVEEAGFQGTVGVLDGTGVDENGLVIGGNGYDAAIDSNSDGLFDYQEFIEIIVTSVTSPQFVCEADNISLEISLETNSDSYDLIAWQSSTDAGVSWQPLAEIPDSFENVNSNILQILNTSLSLSNNLFRAEMSRNDLVCQTFFSEPIEVIIYPLPVIVSDVNLFQCDQDTDGVTVFNLSEANSLISTNYLNENFSYYHFLSDAEQGNTNEIASPIEYENTTNDPAVDPNQIFVRVETTEGCALISTLNLFVSTTQVPSSFSIPPYNECYDDSDGITEFDFSDSETIILALFPPNQPLSVSYYETQTEALSEINAIVDISAYQNSSGNNQTIWIRLDSDIDNSCIGLGPYIELVVNPLPELNTSLDPFYCVAASNSLNLDLNFEFDADILGTQNPNDFTLDYYATLADAESGIGSINSISNTTNLETVFYRIFNNISGCFDIGQFEIDFINIPQANSVPTLVACETDNDGLYLFDTSALEATVLGSQTNMSIAYFDALGNPLQDANGSSISSPFPSTFLTASQTITAVVFNGSCTDAVTNIQFVVNPNTNFSVEDIVICDGNSELIEIDLDAAFVDFNIQWTLPDLTIVTTTQPELLVSQLGEYQVSVANLNGSCEVIKSF
ncbi:MAG: hypothetical protein VXZ57_00775, partial [Bacteroidota bacterium]|nr:hypothetical protein [Bacteroidota bacterium]